MKVIKKINNNVAIAVDGSNREIVVFGKGVGFPRMPYELSDFSQVERTFYDLDSRYYDLIKDIDEKVLRLVSKMMDIMAGKVEGDWNPNLVFILADHINFALQRQREGIRIDFPFSDELAAEQKELNRWAIWIVQNVNKNMNVKLPKGEITCITMHLMNNRNLRRKNQEESLSHKALRIQMMLIEIAEKNLNIDIDRKSLSYVRFKSHIRAFIQRKELNEEIQEGNEEIFEILKNKHPDVFDCVLKMNEALRNEFGSDCSMDELLYLIIHVNRLLQSTKQMETN